MAIVSYIRISSSTQNSARQDLGEVDKEFNEIASGKNASERPQLKALIDYVRDGDTVKVYDISRLARNLRDLQEILETLLAKGVTVTFKKEALTFSADETNHIAKLQLQMMGAFAEFERNIIAERQADGIAKAKARGVYANRERKPNINYDEVRRLSTDGMTPTNISRQLNISRMSVHRILKPVSYTHLTLPTSDLV